MEIRIQILGVGHSVSLGGSKDCGYKVSSPCATCICNWPEPLSLLKIFIPHSLTILPMEKIILAPIRDEIGFILEFSEQEVERSESDLMTVGLELSPHPQWAPTRNCHYGVTLLWQGSIGEELWDRKGVLVRMEWQGWWGRHERPCSCPDILPVGDDGAPRSPLGGPPGGPPVGYSCGSSRRSPCPTLSPPRTAGRGRGHRGLSPAV